jgi:hypothetical protein
MNAGSFLLKFALVLGGAFVGIGTAGEGQRSCQEDNQESHESYFMGT